MTTTQATQTKAHETTLTYTSIARSSADRALQLAREAHIAALIADAMKAGVR